MIPYYQGYQGDESSTNLTASTDDAKADRTVLEDHQASMTFAPHSRDVEAFNRLYVVHQEIGRGAFSVVHRCTNRVTGEDFAVKIIDLRPLQLRENFDQSRLRREVEIMQRLNHPHIIRLEGVYENSQTLMLVMEYAQGTELFDSILQKKRYNEQEARAIFEQIAAALAYLHGLNIVHRDIKPENVILLDATSPEGHYPYAKLLDFGLSKMIGQDDGSAARTFVGTPCYLAPEVEARAYGRGHTYGTKVDCWSLGAVLYVMLVARFPEFDRSNGGMRVRLDTPTWANISEAAKDLIRHLMNPDPAIRYTVLQALAHAWVTGQPFRSASATATAGIMQGMGRLGLSVTGGTPAATNGTTTTPRRPPLPRISVPTMMTPAVGGIGREGMFDAVVTGSGGVGQQEEEPGVEIYKLTSSGDQVPTNLRMDLGTTPIVRQQQDEEPGNSLLLHPVSLPPAYQQLLASTGATAVPTPLGQQAASGAHPLPGAVPSSFQQPQRQLQAFQGDNMKLLPLVHIQHTIANSIEVAYRACEHSPEDAHDIKRSAVLCRSQLIYTVKLLKKIEQTAASVLEMFPDLELAVQEGEPALAHDFFNTVKCWVGDLRHSVAEAQHRNQDSMLKLHKILGPTGSSSSSNQQPRGGGEGQELEEGDEEEKSLRVQDLDEEDAQTFDSLRNVQQQQNNHHSGNLTPEGWPRIESLSSTSSSEMEVGTGEGKVSRVRSRDEELRRDGTPVLYYQNNSSREEGQKEAGIMALDSELYRVVKKLKEANDKDVKLSENQLLDLFFAASAHHQEASVQQLQQKTTTNTSTTTPTTPTTTTSNNTYSSSNTRGHADVGSCAIAELGEYIQENLDVIGEAGEDLSRNSSSSTSTTEAEKIPQISKTTTPPEEGGGGRLLSMEESLDDRTPPFPPPTSHTTTTSSVQQPTTSSAATSSSSPTNPVSSSSPADSSSSSARSSKSRELNLVLAKLKDVDQILEHLAVFWAQTEVILDVLLQKSDHVERFVEFSHNPRLYSRFQQRMGEYRAFWAGIQAMCHTYTSAVSQQTAAAAASPSSANTTAQTVTASAGPRLYQFLESRG